MLLDRLERCQNENVPIRIGTVYLADLLIIMQAKLVIKDVQRTWLLLT